MINIPTQAISFNLYYNGRSASEDLEGGGKTDRLQNWFRLPKKLRSSKIFFIRNVNCKGALLGIQLQGLPEMNLENVELENITIEADKRNDLRRCKKT